MTATIEAKKVRPLPVQPPPPRRGWIEQWDPEDRAFWQATGRRVARRNLAVSILADHLGFCLWVIWTIVVINLANAGITMSLSEQFVLTLVPNLIGSLLRIPYTFALPRFGGRAWTVATTLVLFLPALLLAVVVPSHWLAHQAHATQLWILIGCAATAGFGGGNFASSMANISFFYPERGKGLALGLNAAGGNLGVAVSQLFVPLVIIIGVAGSVVAKAKHPVHLAYAGLMWLPLLAVATFLAWRYMNSLTQAKADTRSYRLALRNRHTAIMSLLYVGTFGSFIGFSFALPLVIKNTFPEFLAGHPFIATYLAGLGFLGALVGSLARPIGGWLSDRVGGGRVTLVAFVGMAAFTLAAISGVERHSFALFFGAYLVIFLLSGIGNGSTYKMIPSIFARLGRQEAERSGALGSGALRSGALGSGALGSGALRSGALRSGALGSGALGSGALGSGALGSGATGALGSGATGPAALGAAVVETAASTAVAVEYRRRAAAVIGIAGAVGAFGGVLVQVAFRQASLHVSALVKAAKTPAAKAAVAAAHANWSVPALWAFLGAYALLAVVTWGCYVGRRSADAG